jgi:hypothetical protein
MNRVRSATKHHIFLLPKFAKMKENTGSTKTLKRFTLDEANAMLPLVNSIVMDIREVFRAVTGRRSDLHRLLRKGSSKSTGQLYADEVAESRADLQVEYDQIWHFREELESLGVMLRQPEEGWVEFPATFAGHEAFFSWRFGEKEILYWREHDAPWTNRKSIGSTECGDI